MVKRNPAIVGSSGEFYVAHILARRGYVVSLPPAKTPRMDLLISNLDGTRLAGIQVKSRWWAEAKRAKKVDRIEFPLPHMNQDASSTTRGAKNFYVLVDLHGGWERTNSGEQPKCYVATKRDIDNYCSRGIPDHWLNLRIPIDEANKHHLERWDKIVKHLGPGWPEN